MYDVRDVSVKVIDILCYPPSDILLTKSAKKMIEKKCQTCEPSFKVLKEINEILTNACITKKKNDEATIMDLRNQISSLKSQLEANDNLIALCETKIKKL